MITKDLTELDKIYLHDAGLITIKHDETSSCLIFQLDLIVDEPTMRSGQVELTFYEVKDVASEPPDLLKMSWRNIGVAEVTYELQNERWQIKWYISVYDLNPSNTVWSGVISFSAISFSYLE